jgi:uncharacterized membrane protein (DUF106 family)
MFIIDFIQWNPFVSILIVSTAIMTFLSTLVYKWTINHRRYKEINERQKQLRNEMKGLKDPKRLQEIQEETLSLSMESMKMSFKPMLITFIPVVIVFGLLRSAYTTAGTGNIIAWGANLPLVGTGGVGFFKGEQRVFSY